MVTGQPGSDECDQVIAYVANENDSADQETAAKALKLISMLCYIKGIYQTLEGKE